MGVRESISKWATRSILVGISIAFFGCAGTGGTHQESGILDVTGEFRPDSTDVYTIYLIGDTGNSSLNPRSPVLQVLRRRLDESGKQSAVIFLGDNIYPHGLPPEETIYRNQAEERIMAQLHTVKDYPGRIIFIPGNHDWKSSEPGGLDRVKLQEQFIESYLNKGNTFLPDSGFPGPVALPLYTGTDQRIPFDIHLIVMDTQWWLHPHDKPVETGIENENQQKEKFLSELQKLIQLHGEQELLIAGHHPLFSYGRHGGKFPFITHLAPPVFGSLYVAYRNIWGYRQDISSYDDLKNGLLNSFSKAENLFYAAGHEHSLQFIPRINDHTRQYYLISGSGSKSSFVKKRSGDIYTYGDHGFIAIHYYRDRTKKIEFWNYRGDIVYQRYIVPTQKES